MAAQSPVTTSLSPDDLRILSSALIFMRPETAGGVVAIVYAGRDEPSHQDAEAIAASVSQYLTPHGRALTPKLVEADALTGATFDLVIVAMGANSEAVARAAASRNALCVTGDQEAVRKGLCAMSIHSANKVEILLNTRATQAEGVSFATAFRMMVSEL
jgi:hypothetical protein